MADQVETTDDFDTAFEQFAAPEDTKNEQHPLGEQPAEEAPAAEAPAEEAPAAEEPAAEEAPAEEESSESVEAPVAEAPEAPAEDSADEILARLSKLVKEAPTKEEPKQEAPAAQAAPQEEEQPVYTKEEQEFLENYNKDWGDVVRGEELKRRAEYRELMQFVFSEIGKFIAPIRETVDVLAERTHRTDIKTTITDYSDDLRDKVIAWAKTQPVYLQTAYDQVIQQGTVDEVRDLVDRYRKETGQVTVQKPTAKKDNELSSEAKKAAAALAPVESKRSGVQQPGDPASYDDAWAQFANPKN